jgi:hypothetical protein
LGVEITFNFTTAVQIQEKEEAAKIGLQIPMCCWFHALHGISK